MGAYYTKTSFRNVTDSVVLLMNRSDKLTEIKGLTLKNNEGLTVKNSEGLTLKNSEGLTVKNSEEQHFPTLKVASFERVLNLFINKEKMGIKIQWGFTSFKDHHPNPFL